MGQELIQIWSEWFNLISLPLPHSQCTHVLESKPVIILNPFCRGAFYLQIYGLPQKEFMFSRMIQKHKASSVIMEKWSWEHSSYIDHRIQTKTFCATPGFKGQPQKCRNIEISGIFPWFMWELWQYIWKWVILENQRCTIALTTL